MRAMMGTGGFRFKREGAMFAVARFSYAVSNAGYEDSL
jgi:hypothetical protein